MSGAEKIRKSVRVLSHAHSDSEADTSGHFYSHTNNPPSIAEDHGHRYERLDFADGNQTDDMDDGEKNNDSTRGRSYSLDEFGDQQDPASHLVRTGRQRKKLAARSKGGEFRTKRRKRRVYFCCVSSEIDVQKLFDYLVGAGSLLNGWKYQLHSDVLHLYKAGYEDSNTRVSSAPKIQPWAEDLQKSEDSIVDSSAADILDEERNLNSIGTTHKMNARDDGALSSNNVRFAVVNTNTGSGSELWTDNSRISGIGAQEVFVFDFGAAVFWGFKRGEETNLLKTIRMFVTKGFVGAQEFHSGEDDMAFVTAADAEAITIANDVITLPDNTPTKQLMSVSFAIAQSTVLAIFEARVELKVEDYRYIPETLAGAGRVQLAGRQLGMMIGEVFVIRHDVNLHTEILDTPDFFWKEKKFEDDYLMVMRYLEMSGRTEVLNKRLDMLRELLDVLQQQMENAHSVKLEWIVIWLIVIEVVLQVLAIGGQSIGLWPAIPA